MLRKITVLSFVALALGCPSALAEDPMTGNYVGQGCRDLVLERKAPTAFEQGVCVGVDMR